MSIPGGTPHQRWTSVAAVADAAIRTEPRLRHTADLLVDVDGTVVWEAHYQPGDMRDIFSITKTVVGLLAGIAVRDRLVHLDDEVEDQVTLRHLLTMTRGAASDVLDIDAIQELPARWVDAIRDWPRVAAPGTTFCYDNNGSHLLAAWLADAVGQRLDVFAADRLFRPLGIEQWEWPSDPEGYCYGFAHLRLPVAGLLAIGRMMLAEGRSGAGKEVVASGWVRAMTTATSAGGPPEGCSYGYLTWVDEHGFFAGGWAGQHLTVLPRDRVVVLTTGLPDLLDEHWEPARLAVLAAAGSLGSLGSVAPFR